MRWQIGLLGLIWANVVWGTTLGEEQCSTWLSTPIINLKLSIDEWIRHLPQTSTFSERESAVLLKLADPGAESFAAIQQVAIDENVMLDRTREAFAVARGKWGNLNAFLKVLAKGKLFDYQRSSFLYSVVRAPLPRLSLAAEVLVLEEKSLFRVAEDGRSTQIWIPHPGLFLFAVPALDFSVLHSFAEEHKSRKYDVQDWGDSDLTAQEFLRKFSAMSPPIFILKRKNRPDQALMNAATFASLQRWGAIYSKPVKFSYRLVRTF